MTIETPSVTSFDVTIEARGGHSGAVTGGHYGSWARVWASRPGIVDVHTVDEDHSYRPGRLTEHDDRVVVRLTLTPAFDHECDYLVVEHKRSPNPYLGGSSHAESYELLAGTMPAWADFPSRWREWVSAVREDAISYLVRLAANEPDPDLLLAIQSAERKTAKGHVASAWEAVARLAGIDPDTIPGTTWTAVAAMPIRIAARLGWRPPIPRPRYERPEDSGRVLVASPIHSSGDTWRCSNPSSAQSI